MENELLQKLVDKSLTKTQLLKKVRQDYGLLPTVFEGTSSSKAAIRYSCAKVLIDLSEENPEKLSCFHANIANPLCLKPLPSAQDAVQERELKS